VNDPREFWSGDPNSAVAKRREEKRREEKHGTYGKKNGKIRKKELDRASDSSFFFFRIFPFFFPYVPVRQDKSG
jgi:hypothetical protein